MIRRLLTNFRIATSARLRRCARPRVFIHLTIYGEEWL